MKEEIEHINHAIGAEFHPPMYLMHMFWARKPSDVVAEWISHYSKEGDIVLDPFCGSGVAPIEAIKLNRKAVGIDINPMAIFLSKMTAKPVDLNKFRDAFRTIKSNVTKEILSLYETECVNCGGRAITKWTVWKNHEPTKIVYKCICKKKALSKSLNGNDKRKLKDIESRQVPYWYPQNRLYYPDGTAFKKKEKSERVSDLFTKRNLIGLSILWNAIQDLPEDEIKDLMKLSFTAILHLTSKMIPDRISRGGPVWTEPSYWVPPRHREINVWDTFEERFEKVLRGKLKSDKNPVIEDYHEVFQFKDLQENKGNIIFICRDALVALREFPDNSVDYVFTDPTYGESIQYGELCYMWASWHGYGEDLLADLKRDEVVINMEGQRKGFDDYYHMLYVIFKEVGRVLKPNRYMTVTFHNPSFEIRNALERAAYIAGFDLENVVYEPPAVVPSKKVSLQPYGSVSGDFYFRFMNAKKAGRELKEDEIAFERIIVDATTRIIADRGEPTPMPIIQNGIEPELSKHGFPFSKRKTAEQVILEHVGKEFVIIDPKTGNVIEKPKQIQDKILWLKEPEKYLLDRVPLEERVEKSIVGILLLKRKVTFTDVMRTLYETFKNALTPNPPSVRKVLEEYAEKIKEGLWSIKYQVEKREKEHDKMAQLLAEVGERIGFRVYADLPRLRGKARIIPVSKDVLDKVKDIDVIWFTQSGITHEFEIENTTGITEAIRRGANIPYKVNRVIVIPEERMELLKRRAEEPFVGEGIKKYNWKFLYYDDLEKFYNANIRKKRIDITDFEKLIRTLDFKRPEPQEPLTKYT